VGGSLGTALLNTLFAGTVTAYLTDNARSPEEAQQLAPAAFIEGYHVAFFWGAMLLVAALLTSLFLINARKQDVPAEPGMASA
jgi:ABC-type Na+ efflux pump permease subunit